MAERTPVKPERRGSSKSNASPVTVIKNENYNKENKTPALPKNQAGSSRPCQQAAPGKVQKLLAGDGALEALRAELRREFEQDYQEKMQAGISAMVKAAFEAGMKVQQGAAARSPAPEPEPAQKAVGLELPAEAGGVRMIDETILIDDEDEDVEQPKRASDAYEKFHTTVMSGSEPGGKTEGLSPGIHTTLVYNNDLLPNNTSSPLTTSSMPHSPSAIDKNRLTSPLVGPTISPSKISELKMMKKRKCTGKSPEIQELMDDTERGSPVSRETTAMDATCLLNETVPGDSKESSGVGSMNQTVQSTFTESANLIVKAVQDSPHILPQKQAAECQRRLSNAFRDMIAPQASQRAPLQPTSPAAESLARLTKSTCASRARTSTTKSEKATKCSPKAEGRNREKSREIWSLLGNADMSALVLSTGDCLCDRGARTVCCQTCGKSFEGRMRLKCSVHPKERRLTDLESCPACGSANLAENAAAPSHNPTSFNKA